MKISKLATYKNGLDLAATLALEKQHRLLSLTEHDLLLKGDGWKEYENCYPAWTALHMKYEKGATTALIWEHGQKPRKVNLPLADGWYEQGKDGIPNGKPSDSSNPNARYLWRWQDRAWEGLVVRRGWDWDGDYGRDVDCVYDGYGRFGVLGREGKAEKHKCRFVCETCGKRRK